MSIKIIVVLAALVFVIIGVPDSQDQQFHWGYAICNNDNTIAVLYRWVNARLQ